LKERLEVQRRIGKIFFLIALKSANETKYWLCLIRDTLEIDKVKIKELISEAEEISNIVATIVVRSESK
jgi:four helix bundle protein